MSTYCCCCHFWHAELSTKVFLREEIKSFFCFSPSFSNIARLMCRVQTELCSLQRYRTARNDQVLFWILKKLSVSRCRIVWESVKECQEQGPKVRKELQAQPFLRTSNSRTRSSAKRDSHRLRVRGTALPAVVMDLEWGALCWGTVVGRDSSVQPLKEPMHIFVYILYFLFIELEDTGSQNFSSCTTVHVWTAVMEKFNLRY